MKAYEIRQIANAVMEAKAKSERGMPVKWLNAQEAALYLGVSLSYVRKNIKDIPHTKLGRMCRFTHEGLNKYLLRE